MPTASQIRGKYRAMESRGGREITRTNDLKAAKAIARVTGGVVTQSKRGREVEIYSGGTERVNPSGDSSVRSPTSTSSEVRSPTSTSTEVRSPTSTDTSTEAYTADNVTVTGGAGAGANTTVHIRGTKRGADIRRPGDSRATNERDLTSIPDSDLYMEVGRRKAGAQKEAEKSQSLIRQTENPYGQLWFDAPQKQLAAWKKLRAAGFTTRKWKDNNRIGTDKPQYFLTYSGNGDPSDLERVLMQNPRGGYFEHSPFAGAEEEFKNDIHPGMTVIWSKDDSVPWRVNWVQGGEAGLQYNAVTKKAKLKDLKRNPHRNPESSAAELYEDFHGVPSDRIIEVSEEDHWHENLTELGDLVVLKVRTVTDLDATISFEAVNGEFPVKLASSEDGKQLFFVGGSQELDLSTIEMDCEELIRDSMLIGELYMVHYVTKKGFDKFEEVEYFHELSEEGGPLPVLIYDSINKKLSMAGGSYEVRPEGIVN